MEVVITFVLVALVAMIGVATYARVSEKTSDAGVKREVEAIARAQQIRYGSRGAFATLPAAASWFRQAEAEIEVTDTVPPPAGTVSVAVGTVSVAFGDYSGGTEVAVSASEGTDGNCLAAVVADPDDSHISFHHWDRHATDGCAAVRALSGDVTVEDGW